MLSQRWHLLPPQKSTFATCPRLRWLLDAPRKGPRNWVFILNCDMTINGYENRLETSLPWKCRLSGGLIRKYYRAPPVVIKEVTTCITSGLLNTSASQTFLPSVACNGSTLFLLVDKLNHKIQNNIFLLNVLDPQAHSESSFGSIYLLVFCHWNYQIMITILCKSSANHIVWNFL